jgi:hypothetical protein
MVEEVAEKNTKPPLTLAFEADAKHLRSIMESGTKKARAFFPNEITDLFVSAGGKDPKPRYYIKRLSLSLSNAQTLVCYFTIFSNMCTSRVIIQQHLET